MVYLDSTVIPPYKPPVGRKGKTRKMRLIWGEAYMGDSLLTRSFRAKMKSFGRVYTFARVYIYTDLLTCINIVS